MDALTLQLLTAAKAALEALQTGSQLKRANALWLLRAAIAAAEKEMQ